MDSEWCWRVDMSAHIGECLKHYVGVSACQRIYGKFYSFGNVVHVI